MARTSGRVSAGTRCSQGSPERARRRTSVDEIIAVVFWQGATSEYGPLSAGAECILPDGRRPAVRTLRVAARIPRLRRSPSSQYAERHRARTEIAGLCRHSTLGGIVYAAAATLGRGHFRSVPWKQLTTGTTDTRNPYRQGNGQSSRAGMHANGCPQVHAVKDGRLIVPQHLFTVLAATCHCLALAVQSCSVNVCRDRSSLRATEHEV
jgi:hypothetical protein